MQSSAHRGQVRRVLGRAPEIAALLRVVDGEPAAVVFVHGIAGIGKSLLLEEFAQEVRTRGATVVAIDCGEVEPTEAGFLTALGEAVGGAPEEAVGQLERLGDRVVITLDSYELLRLLDGWIRSSFVPLLPASARVVLAGREPPAMPWLSIDGFRALALGPLEADDAEALLMSAGMREEQARRVNRVVRGYPLGLTMAMTTERIDLDVAEAAAQAVVAELTRTYLAGLDPLTLRALDAASVVRRATLPLLASMLPAVAPRDAYDRLHALPFVEARLDGLALHEVVREAVATAREAADPEQSRRDRRAAWRHLRAQLRRAPRHELWRYTADMLYLIGNPVVRDAFFPAGRQRVLVEPAKEEDEQAVLAIATRHEPPSAVALVQRWWRSAPEAFYAVRDTDGAVVGFSCVLERRMVTQPMVRADPVARRWWEHLRAEPLPKGQTALFHRWWLGRDLGEAPSPAQAATWLDLKRLYMELRPALRRVYGVVRQLDTYVATFGELGFRPLDGAAVDIDGVANHCAVLDFGPASVDGWLTWLAASELGIDAEHGILDLEQRELVLDGKRVPLTKLEFEVMRYLWERDGRPVSRADLLRDVWGYDFAGASNVVDVIVRSLRLKLGDRAATIETVRSVGYRLRRDR